VDYTSLTLPDSWSVAHQNRARKYNKSCVFATYRPTIYPPMSHAPTPLPAQIQALAARLASIPGIAAVVLGGSHATGTQTAGSDVDLGLYYRRAQPPDVATLDALAREFDDRHASGLVTPIGEWEPWINGGGWLRIDGTPVDLLYRELDKVGDVIDQCHAGVIELAYQPGHPHLFCSTIYMGEVDACVPLADPSGVLAALKARTRPYPETLRRTVIARFAWEAGFSVIFARKAVERRDWAYLAGSLFRATACMAQTLFALNRRYLLNEKGAIQRTDGFDITLPDLAARVGDAFRIMTDAPHDAIGRVQTLTDELDALVRRTSAG
jgi:hypothetical protein